MRKAKDRKLKFGFGTVGRAVLVALLVGALPGSARAFDDLIARSGRLAYVSGDVRILNAGSPDATAAQLNMPLSEGVRVETGDDGEAEVEFEDGSLVRMTPKSSVLLVRMVAGADGRYGTEMELTSGLVYANLRATAKYAYRIDVGRDYVTPLANATIRILLDQPPATVAVLDGTAHVERVGSQPDGGFQVDVDKGESLRGDSTGGSRYFLTQQIDENSWDKWNEEREQGAADAAAARTSARDLYAGDRGYGWSDLDANGTWYDAGQGPVWQPFDASLSGFDPYGYGSWVWSPGPGYVWSSGYAWGWTPFRCGRWNYWQDFGWGWVPSAGYDGGGGGLRAGSGTGINRRRNTINLSNVPAGYQRPLPPVVGGPVRVHPIVSVRSGPAPTGERREESGGRQIAGLTAMPLRPEGGGYTPRGGSAVGSSLRRDFPVDRITRRPMMGAVTAPPKPRAAAVAGRTPAAGGGVADGATGSAAGAGSVSNQGLVNQGLVNQGLGNQGLGNEGRRADGLTTEAGRRGVHPGDIPATVGRSAAGTEGTRSAYPARNGAVLPPGSSVAAPPPQAVRVHPGDRPDYRSGERSSERVEPVNRTTAPLMPRVTPMPSERSMPTPPSPMRSAPPASAPAQVMRSSPAPTAPSSAPAPATAPATAPPASSPKK